MAAFIIALLFLLSELDRIGADVDQSRDPTEPMCYDWGESNEGGVSVLDGEAGWLSCPLFSHPSVYNYTSTQSAGHNLFWYRIPEGHDLEQPITYSSRLSKDRERLWLQPAAANDSGLYICMLRNKSSCSKIAMRLTVLRLDEVVHATDCKPPVAVAATHVYIPLQEGKNLDCPDLEDVSKMSETPPTVSWTHVRPNTQLCKSYPFWNSEREQRGARLRFHVMLETYQGLYFCVVQYRRRNRTLSFTRSINVSAIYPTNVSKHASILNPTKDQLFTVKSDSEVRLVCRALVPFIPDDPSWEMWWTVDGKMLEKLPDQHRFSQTIRELKNDHMDLTMESVLQIQDFQSEDLKREFNCSVKNHISSESRRAQLEEEVSLPSVELGCGLGVTLVLMLLLFVVYHVFWLELLLLYRSWFGTDERHTDEKEYDVYISYARNSEEEQFVLSTLRSVLENELGYSVCIFDRDSLPGGTITDETLSFVARSRRLLVVVSPGYASQGSQALLELKAGIDGMALGGHLQVILVQYKPVQRQVWVRELRRARVALAVLRWQGDKSKELTSRFWKRLRLELPVRRDSISGGSSKDVALMRLTSQNNSSEDILRSMQRSRRLLFVLSPDFLTEKSFGLLECRLGLYLQHAHRTSIVAVVYRSVSKLPCVEVAQLRQASVCTVTWRGSRSEPRRSRFWLRLRLALPVRPLALGRRMIDSTSSHSDLAALALQRVQRIQNQGDAANQSYWNRRTLAIQSRRDRKPPPRRKSSVRRGVRCREEGPWHSRSCSVCAEFVCPVEGGVELRVETQVQQVSCDRTEVRSDPIPETDSIPVPDSTHDSNHAPPNCQQEDTDNDVQQQQLTGSRTSEEVMSPSKGEGLIVRKVLTPPLTTIHTEPLTDV